MPATGYTSGDARKMDKSANLSDVASASTSRTNLGLGTAAVTNTGTGAGNTILGNDARLTDARTPATHAASHASGGGDPVTLAQSQVTNLVSDLAGKAAASHTHTIRKTIVLGDDRPTLSTGSGSMRWYNREGVTLTIVGAWASAGVVPTGADIIVDINANGSTIFSTQANRPTITAASSGGAISATPNTTSLASGDYLTVDIDQVGSTIAGGQLAVGIVVTYAG